MGTISRIEQPGRECFPGHIATTAREGTEDRVLLVKLDREVKDEPDGPLLPPVAGHELIRILRIAHPVEGRRGAGAPTPATDRVGGRVEVASRGLEVLSGRQINGSRPPTRLSPAPRPQKRDCTLRSWSN